MTQWRTLPALPSASLPPLLVSAEFTPTTYRILVSDLAHVWAEELDRRSICMRGWKENTVIDPSDTPANMERFLGYLHSALDDSHPDHEATALRVSGYMGSETGPDGLLLEIVCELEGLGQLKWPVYLSPKPPTTGLAPELVVPLLRAQSARAHEISALATLLGHKDSIISRLLDALEAAHVGLEKAFPTLAPGSTVRKKVSRSAAEDKIQGLVPFELGQWKEDIGDALSPRVGGVGGLVEDVFGGEGVQYEPGRDVVGEGIDMESWWRGYEGKRGRRARKVAKEVEVPRAQTPTRRECEEDEFQVQSTPEHLKTTKKSTSANQSTNKPTKKSTKRRATDDDETASESSPPPPPKAISRAHKNLPPPDDDIDDEFQRQATPPRLKPQAATPPQKTPARIGSLGGGRTPQPMRPRVMDDDESTASEEDEPLRGVGRIGGEEPPPRRVIGKIGGEEPPPRRVIGKIGGEEPPPPRTIGKIGKIGGDEPPPRRVIGKIGARPPPIDDDSTASEDDGPPRTTTASPPRTGGSASPTKQSTSPTSFTAIETTIGARKTTSPPPPRRLGKIGGGPTIATTASANASQQPQSPTKGGIPATPSKGRSLEALLAEEKKEETEEERANRIREGIKTERERKAAAGPVKKRRKF